MLSNANDLPATGYVRESQIIPHIVPVGHATLWRMVKDQRFPKPYKISSRITAWRAEDVRAWLQAVGQ
jgi:prophage regulatory protein